MNTFAIARPRSFEEASGLLAGKRFRLPVLKAGGMDILDLLKEGLIEPDAVINIQRLRQSPTGDRDPIQTHESEPHSSIWIEATATLADIASSPLLRRDAPALAQSVENAATPQVRNVATAAGNLLQRPRCWYFRHEQFDCLKKGGATCYAVNGENRYHAIFGDGPCHIVHPSNLAPALWVCDGVVHLVGGERRELPISSLFHSPDKGIRDEHNLRPGEVVTHITCRTAPKSGFYAVKEKQSFDWPLVAVAAALELDGEKIASARVCAGAVAPVPWPLLAVENALKGVAITDDGSLRKACALAAEGAKPMSENGYKASLLPVAVRRAVLLAAGRTPEVEA